MILDKVNYPEDLKCLKDEEKITLATEIREKIIDTVSETGGHLASNLGIVELTIAIHSIFNTPIDFTTEWSILGTYNLMIIFSFLLKKLLTYNKSEKKVIILIISFFIIYFGYLWTIDYINVTKNDGEEITYKPLETYTIPVEVTKLGKECFSNCKVAKFQLWSNSNTHIGIFHLIFLRSGTLCYNRHRIIKRVVGVCYTCSLSHIKGKTICNIKISTLLTGSGITVLA